MLKEQIKRKLNITFDDVETDKRIEEIIESAIPVLIYRLGIADSDFDFSKPGMENVIFKNYCLYEWNHCVDDFWNNYAEDIAQCRRIHIMRGEAIAEK